MYVRTHRWRPVDSYHGWIPRQRRDIVAEVSGSVHYNMALITVESELNAHWPWCIPRIEPDKMR